MLTNERLEEISNIDKLSKKDIEEILMFDESDRKQFEAKIFSNETAKKDIINKMNHYIIIFINKLIESKENITDQQKIIYENYMKYYCEKGFEINYDNKEIVILMSTIKKGQIASNFKGREETKEFLKSTYDKNKIFEKFTRSTRKLVEKMKTENQEDLVSNIETYDFIFKYVLDRVSSGYYVEETETLFKILNETEGITIENMTCFDQYNEVYNKNREKGIKRNDEVFSLLLDYEEMIKKSQSTKELKYSPIEDMKNRIETGKYGSTNENGEYKLAKEEMAFAIKIIENPSLVDKEVLQQVLSKISDCKDMQLGKREIKNLIIRDQNFVDRIQNYNPQMYEQILNIIDKQFIDIINKIPKSNEEMTEEEKQIVEGYLEKYFEKFAERKRKDHQLTEVFTLIRNIARPNHKFNMTEITRNTQNIEFFKKQYTDKNIMGIYGKQIMKISNEMLSNEKMKKEEFDKNDDMLSQIGYISILKNSSTKKIFQGLMKRSKELNMRSKSIDNIIEVYIDYNASKNKEVDDDELRNMIVEYVEVATDRSPDDIMTNAPLNHIFQEAQLKRLPEHMNQKIIDILEKKKEQIQEPDMTKYDEIIQSNQEMPKEMLKQFLHDIASVRLLEETIPEKYNSYIIKEDIMGRIEDLQYKGVVERALEDFGKYELKKNGIDNFAVKIVNQEILGDPLCNGRHYSKRKNIDISRKNIEKYGSFKIIETILHECTHAEQSYNRQTGKMNGKTFKMLKEKIIKENIKDFYDANYKYMEEEIDARMQGYVKRIDALREIGIPDEKIAELDALNLKEKITLAKEQQERGNHKNLNGKMQDVDHILFETIHEKTEILEEFPQMKIEFEERDGKVEKKSFVDILQNCEENLNQAKDKEEKGRITNLYLYIVGDNIPIPEDRMKDELEKLLNMKSNNEIVNALINKTIETRFPKEMVEQVREEKSKEWKKNLEEFYYQSTIDSQQEATDIIKQQIQKENKKDSQQARE